MFQFILGYLWNYLRNLDMVPNLLRGICGYGSDPGTKSLSHLSTLEHDLLQFPVLHGIFFSPKINVLRSRRSAQRECDKGHDCTAGFQGWADLLQMQ